MGELGGGARFAQKAIPYPRLFGEVGWQHFDRDFTIQVDIDSQINDAHPAAAKLAENPEIGSERPRQAGQLRLLVGCSLGEIQRRCLFSPSLNLALTNCVRLGEINEYAENRDSVAEAHPRRMGTDPVDASSLDADRRQDATGPRADAEPLVAGRVVRDRPGAHHVAHTL